MAGEIKKLLFSDGVTVSSPSALALVELVEGTFTPVLKEGANTLTVASATGCYRKVGKTVFADLNISNITKSGSGTLTIEGLPYASESGDCPAIIGDLDLDRFTVNVGSTSVFITSGSSIISFTVRDEAGGAATALTASELDASLSDINIHITYPTDS